MTRPNRAMINQVNVARLVSYSGLLAVGAAFGPAWTIGLSFAAIAYIELVVYVGDSVDRWLKRASERRAPRAPEVVDTFVVEIVDKEEPDSLASTPARTGKRFRITIEKLKG